MKLVFTSEAVEQADVCDAWWREHRDVRDLFARELAGAKDLLLTSPHVGTALWLAQLLERAQKDLPAVPRGGVLCELLNAVDADAASAGLEERLVARSSWRHWVLGAESRRLPRSVASSTMGAA